MGLVGAGGDRLHVHIVFGRRLALGPFLKSDQRGVAGVEATVAAIALLVVASIFAYVIVTTGKATSESTEKKLAQAISLSLPTLTLWGTIVGESKSEMTTLDRLRFQLVNPWRGSDGIDVIKADTVVTYIDEHQIVHLSQEDWNVTWLVGSPHVIEPGEKVEIIADLTGLDPPLGPFTRFSIQVSPKFGTTLTISKITPAKLAAAFDLP